MSVYFLLLLELLHKLFDAESINFMSIYPNINILSVTQRRLAFIFAHIKTNEINVVVFLHYLLIYSFIK